MSVYVPLYGHETAEYVKASKAPTCFGYKVAKDADLNQIVHDGKVCSSFDIDYTVNVEAKNLEPYKRYWSAPLSDKIMKANNLL